ncbi:glycosyltransferase family 4 protein [Kaistella sp.]|uniref:glycosyltransferase family 4 protein n=1 Tax=Kaistella sp. TaxID=2782235 RepID=UPI002F9250B1
MRILYCIASFSAKGGTEKVLSSKAMALSGKGHEVFILISDQHQKPFAYDLPQKIEVKDLGITRFLKTGFKGLDFLRNIYLLRKLYRSEIEAIKPDIIIVPERGYEDFVIPYVHRNIPKIREYHFSRKASEFLESTMKIRERLKARFIRSIYESQYKRYDSFVILTEKDASSWKHFKNVSIIPNVVEEKNADQSVPLLQRPKRIIAVGSMVADRKGFSELIKIWSELAADFTEWTVHIFGDGPYRSVYEKEIRDLQLQERIVLEGISDNIQSEYQQSQVFVMTSKGEGLPMVIIEAQQNGIPVIVYDCYSGPSDILKNDRGGYLVPMQDKVYFSSMLKKILVDAELRNKKGDEAVANSLNYLPSVIIPQWEQLFKNLSEQ